jgi:polyferredoxin
LCIDACNAVMDKIGRPRGLIAYDTDVNIKRRMEGKEPFFKLVRLRTVLYSAIIVVAGGLMLYTLATREGEGISVIHDRNPMFTRLSDGSVRNGYTIRIVNKQLKKREFALGFNGLPATLISLVGVPPREDGELWIDVGPDQTREIRAVVTDYGLPPPPKTTVVFRLTDIATGQQATARDHFFAPEVR